MGEGVRRNVQEKDCSNEVVKKMGQGLESLAHLLLLWNDGYRLDRRSVSEETGEEGGRSIHLPFHRVFAGDRRRGCGKCERHILARKNRPGNGNARYAERLMSGHRHQRIAACSRPRIRSDIAEDDLHKEVLAGSYDCRNRFGQESSGVRFLHDLHGNVRGLVAEGAATHSHLPLEVVSAAVHWRMNREFEDFTVSRIDGFAVSQGNCSEAPRIVERWICA